MMNEPISTNGTNVVGTIRATYYKNGERNILQNLENNLGYEGIIEPIIVASRGRNPENPSDRTAGIHLEQRLEPNSSGLCNTITSVEKDSYVLERDMGYRIRKLTPRECGRLMDVSDDDIDKMEAVMSKTQMYKQFGNSICCNVLVAIFGQLFEGKEDIYKYNFQNS